MAEFGEVVNLLDEVVGINTKRAALHYRLAGPQVLQRRENEEYHAYYLYVSWFMAQRACQTAQANALLLRHGFQDQAFELWRTLVNLHEQLEGMIGDQQEREAEKYLSSIASEMMYLDKEAKRSGSVGGNTFNDSSKDVMNLLDSAMRIEYGDRILRMDGWKAPDRASSVYALQGQYEAETDHLYRLASKLVHGSPISTMIGADLDKEPMRSPLEHKTVGVPVQCIMTGRMLDLIVTMFCHTTEEKSGKKERYLRERSNGALSAMSELSTARRPAP